MHAYCECLKMTFVKIAFDFTNCSLFDNKCFTVFQVLIVYKGL